MARSRLLVIVLVVFSLLWGASPVMAAGGGIGVAPSQLEIESALRGSEYTRTFYLINPGDAEAYYTLTADEGEAFGWVAFYADEETAEPIDVVTVPAKGRVPLVMRLAIPDDAANRTYRLTITAQSVAKPLDEGAEGEAAEVEPSGGSAVTVRAQAEIIMQVTGTQVLTGEVPSVVVENTEVNYPLRARVQFQNTGNVDARPDILVEVLAAGAPVTSFSHSDSTVQPGAQDIIVVEGDIQGVSAGAYQARVTVSLDGKVIAAQEQDIQVFPLGTLTRDGALTSLVTEGDPFVGLVLKVLGSFANTGLIETPARLIAEVYRDGNLIRVEESTELRVLPKEAETLTAYHELQEPGEYTIKAHVLFGDRTTAVSELNLTVIAAPAQAPSEVGVVSVSGNEVAADGANARGLSPLVFLENQSLGYVIAMGGVVLIAGFLVVSLILERRKRNRNAVP